MMCCFVCSFVLCAPCLGGAQDGLVSGGQHHIGCVGFGGYIITPVVIFEITRGPGAPAVGVLNVFPASAGIHDIWVGRVDFYCAKRPM